MLLAPLGLTLSLLGAPLGGDCLVRDSDEARGDLRPALSGPVSQTLSADAVFRVHWTDSGEDAIDADRDEDANGIPDDIDRILVGLEEGLSTYEAEGWRRPRSDLGGGGTDELDVYVRDISAFGYAHVEPTSQGASCYMELDPGNNGLGEGAVESVAAHELHHCVQYAYTTASHSWLYESTATWQQYRLFSGPALDLAVSVLWNQRLRGMDSDLNTLGDRFEYAGFVVMKFWAESGEGASSVVSLWETLEELPPWRDALDEASREQRGGQSWARTFAEYATWNLFACARDDGGHYDPAVHPCILDAVTVELDELAEGAEEVELVHAAGDSAARYALLPAGGDERPAQLTCSFSPDEARVVMGLVGVDSLGTRQESAFEALEPGEETVLRLEAAVDPGGAFGLVSAAVDGVPPQVSCRVERVDPVPEPEPSTDCSCSSAPRPGTALAAGLVFLVGCLRRRTRTSPGCGAC